MTESNEVGMTRKPYRLPKRVMFVRRQMREPLWRHMLGEQLRVRRTGRGETLGEVAVRAGVSPQYLSEIERGRKEPSSEIISAVSDALEISLLDLTLNVAQSLKTHSESSSIENVSLAIYTLAA